MLAISRILLLPLLIVPALEHNSKDELLVRCNRLDTRLQQLTKLAEVPGVSIAAATAEGVVWRQASGLSDLASGRLVDAHTVFEAASLSKPVFAYIVHRFVDEGLLALDTPLVEYAELSDLAHDPRCKLLTARMVLSHTTGLPNWRANGGRLEFEYEPEERWNYSGEGFVLLQGVVEELAGDSLQGLATEFVFGPLGMQRSSFVWMPGFSANVAYPHDVDGQSRANRKMQEANAAYSLLTTAGDYALFLSALLRGAGLSKESRLALLTPVVEVNAKVSWGHGIGLEQNSDGLALWHWGHNSGYRAYMLAYPKRNEALVFFTNSDNGMRFLADLVSGISGQTKHPAIDHLNYANYREPEKSD